MRPLDKPTRGWGVALPQRRRDARAGRGSCFLAYVGPPCTLRDHVCAGDVRRHHSSIRAASRPQLLMQWRVRHTHRPDCDDEPYTQRLEVPQARRSTSQHIAASVREGRPKPSLTVPSETAPVGRAHAAAKQSRAGCGAVHPRHWRTRPSRPHDLRSSCGIVGKTTQGGWLLTSGPQDRASALEEEVVIEVDRHSRRLGTRRGDAFNVCPRRT